MYLFPGLGITGYMLVKLNMDGILDASDGNHGVLLLLDNKQWCLNSDNNSMNVLFLQDKVVMLI